MVQPASSNKPKRSFIARVLFFWLHPVMLVILALAVAALFLAAPFRLITRSVELPDFAGPEQESFWRLQEKLLDLENSHDTMLTLNHSEFNAFLAGFQMPPESGFCLQRLRCIADNASASLYIIGSGFFMRSLVFQLGISMADSKLQIERLHINSLELAGGSWGSRYVLQYLEGLAMKMPDSFVVKILQGRCSVGFSADNIVLKGEFMPARPRSEVEETPTVESESEEPVSD